MAPKHLMWLLYFIDLHQSSCNDITLLLRYLHALIKTTLKALIERFSLIIAFTFINMSPRSLMQTCRYVI